MADKKIFECPVDLYAPTMKKRDKQENLLKNRMTYLHFVNTELQMLASMFEYRGLPSSIDTNYLELCIIRYGVCAIVKISDDRYYAGVPALLPPLTDYGWGTKVELITRNGEVINNRIVGKDCALIWNNNTRTSEFDLYRFAENFTDVEISAKSIVRNSRKSPIPVAKNGKLKTAIDEALNNSQNGLSDTTVINDVSLQQEINGQTADIPVLNLTDVKDVDRLQYLSKYHDDLLRRLATMYGHAMQTSGKLAQQSISELQEYDTYSEIMPNIRLTERRKGIEQFNEVFGMNATVEYGKAWKHLNSITGRSGGYDTKSSDSETDIPELEI